MPHLSNDQQITILSELEALKKQGYKVTVQHHKLSNGGVYLTTASIIPVNQLYGITLVMPKSNDFSKAHTVLDAKDFHEFVSNFPVTLAPTISKWLNNEPPEIARENKNQPFMIR